MLIVRDHGDMRTSSGNCPPGELVLVGPTGSTSTFSVCRMPVATRRSCWVTGSCRDVICIKSNSNDGRGRAQMARELRRTLERRQEGDRGPGRLQVAGAGWHFTSTSQDERAGVVSWPRSPNMARDWSLTGWSLSPGPHGDRTERRLGRTRSVCAEASVSRSDTQKFII